MSEDEPHSADLTRLVQHVALNESGWWDQAIERLILACAYTLGPSTQSDLCEMVDQSSGGQPNSDRLTATLERLIAAGSLVEFDGAIRVSEEVREALAAHEATTLSSESDAHHRFLSLAEVHGLSDRGNELWSVLETEVVLPIVRHMGARMYGLLTSSSDGNGDLEKQMTEFLGRHGEEVRTLFGEFMDPTLDHVRSFVLRRLNAQYAVDAAALPSEALDRLAQLDAKPSRVDVFLDTNFLLSVLGLHDNPGDDVAVELLALVHELRERVNLRLYVLPITVEETRRVLRDVIVRLSGFRGQTNLAEAARRVTSTGLAARYFEEARQSPAALRAEDFFGPYESDLVAILRSKSVELYNTNLDELRTDQDVIDDLHDQSERQEKYRARGAKSYDANLHDMVLWHFAKRTRSAVAESPLEVTSWIATLDYGLLSFDRYKRRKSVGGPPVCLEPSALIQLFQFWVPSSVGLDEALVGSIRQPLLFLNFDAESEQVTLRILAQLSRFDGAADLGPDVATEILANSALRGRISGSGADRSDDEEIVRDELFDVVAGLGKQLADLQRERDEVYEAKADLEIRAADAASKAVEVENERVLRQAAESSLQDERAELARAEAEAERLLGTTGDLESRVGGLEDTNRQLVKRIEGRDRAESRKSENRKLGALIIVSLMVSFGLLVGGGLLLGEWMRSPLAWIAAASGAGFVLLLGAEMAVNGTRFAQSDVALWVKRLRKSWWAFALAVVASVVAGWILGD